MKLSAIGHHSWIVESSNSTVFIDPVVKSSFGVCEYAQFDIFPPRNIDFARLPKPEAVILTSPHAGRFDLESLSSFEKGQRIVVSRWSPRPMLDALRKVFSDVWEVSPGRLYELDSFKFRFMNSSQSAPAWEQRVCHLFLESKDRESIFFQGDSPIDEESIRSVGLNRFPDAIVLSFNSQIAPPCEVGPFDNLLPTEMKNRDRFRVLRNISSGFVDAIGKLNRCANLVVSGSGFVVRHKNSVPFIWSDPRKLAEKIQYLSPRSSILGLRPGESAKGLSGQIERTTEPWAAIDEMKWAELLGRQQKPKMRSSYCSVRPIFTSSGSPDSNDEEVAIRELRRLAPLALSSSFGEIALNLTDYTCSELGAQRLAFRLLRDRDQTPLHFLLDFNSAAFEPTDCSASELIQSCPFGVELFLRDFAALARGEIPIWDLAMSSMRQWYLGDFLFSPVAFLFEAYAEHVRTDLFRANLEIVLKRIVMSQKIQS